MTEDSKQTHCTQISSSFLSRGGVSAEVDIKSKLTNCKADKTQPSDKEKPQEPRFAYTLIWIGHGIPCFKGLKARWKKQKYEEKVLVKHKEFTV